MRFKFLLPARRHGGTTVIKCIQKPNEYSFAKMGGYFLLPSKINFKMIKNRSIIVIMILAFSLGQIFGQVSKDLVTVKRSEFKTDKKEGFQEAWTAIRDAEDFLLQGKEAYSPAKKLYLEAYKYNSENPELNYLLGICYFYTGDNYEALKYLKKAYEKRPNVSKDINFLLGRAYHHVLEFDKAIENYYAYRKSLGAKDALKFNESIDKLVSECRNGKLIIKDPKRLIITNLGDSINSEFDDYFSLFATPDSIMYFTSRRPKKEKSKRNPYDNKFYEDVYLSSLNGGEWSAAKPLSKKIDSKDNDAAVGISNDGNQLFIYQGAKNGGDIYVSNRKKGEWTSPESWGSKLSSKQSESALFFTKSGDTVYFISSNEDLTIGGKDILISHKNIKGKWQKPENVSSLVNSKYDEQGIFLTPDGKTMYFSSRGHNTMGGYDVFKSVMQVDGTWSDPENMGYPVNTPDDEVFFCFSTNGKAAYLSSTREGGKGAKDIYKLIFLGSEKEMVLANEDILIAGINDSVKTAFFSMPDPIEIDSFYYLKGRVLNKSNNEPVVAKIEFVDSTQSKVVATAISTESGEYQAKFPEAKTYAVEVNAKDYLFFLDKVDMSTASTDEPFMKDFLIDKVEVGKKVVLEKIFFETSKAALRTDSNPELNQVIGFLKNNETIRLEISGHTDNVGSSKVNLKLSEDRAKAVVTYLINNGIEKSRLVAVGYGFSQPIAPNDTPSGREQNRRVEFKVISK
jgi:outer membrane protein OmpA-like peptidoglycan-associated protein/tetratricopeptide (TPR) repeat protein